MKEISYYYTIDNECPYLDWFHDLDTSIQVRVNKRVKKLREGLYGDHKPLQKSEKKVVQKANQYFEDYKERTGYGSNF